MISKATQSNQHTTPFEVRTGSTYYAENGRFITPQTKGSKVQTTLSVRDGQLSVLCPPHEVPQHSPRASRTPSDGLGRLHVLPPGIRSMIWSHLAVPHMTKRRMSGWQNTLVWTPLWRVSTTIATEYLPFLYARNVRFEFINDCIIHHIKVCVENEDGVYMAFVVLESQMFPFISQRQERYLHTPWTRFTSLTVELLGNASEVGQIGTWFGHLWLTCLFDRSARLTNSRFENIRIEIMEDELGDPGWLTSHGTPTNILTGSGGYFDTHFSKVAKQTRSDVDIFLMLYHRVQVRHCQSFTLTLPELLKSDAGYRSFLSRDKPLGKFRGDILQDERADILVDALALSFMIMLDTRSDANETFDIVRAVSLGKWTHETVAYAAEVLHGSKSGTVGGAIRLVTLQRAKMFSRLLYRKMQYAQMMALKTPDRRGYNMDAAHILRTSFHSETYEQDVLDHCGEGWRSYLNWEYSFPSFTKLKQCKKLAGYGRVGAAIDPYFSMSRPWDPEHLRCLALGKVPWTLGPPPWVRHKPIFSDTKLVPFDD